jgi:hypothetical protein
MPVDVEASMVGKRAKAALAQAKRTDPRRQIADQPLATGDKVRSAEP